MALEASQEKPSPFLMVIEYVQEMQDRINKITPIARQKMTEAQTTQNWVYDWPARPSKFQLSYWVLLLVPSPNRKFLGRWQGPFTVME